MEHKIIKYNNENLEVITSFEQEELEHDVYMSDALEDTMDLSEIKELAFKLENETLVMRMDGIIG